jgi:hypothetical protein
MLAVFSVPIRVSRSSWLTNPEKGVSYLRMNTMKQSVLIPEKLALREGAGYWDVTKHPMGGDFRRNVTGQPLDADNCEVVGVFNDSSPRLIRADVVRDGQPRTIVSEAGNFSLRQS